LIYVFYLLAIIFLADYFFYLSYRSKIIPSELPNNKLTKLQAMLGWVGPGKKSSFSNFEKTKKTGIIRIGCFGDSFTWGDEVGYSYDYPSLLQEIFFKKGYKNVEVINFGMSWYGFQQSFMLWELLGREYALDYVVLGPACFQQVRDSTFNQTFADSYLKGYVDALHARYILKGRGIKRIEVIGNTTRERVLNYYRFMPHLVYLKFDSNPPSFLVAPIACLFPHRKLKVNPFYYKSDLIKEINEIYRIALLKMADVTPQVILGNYDQGIVSLARNLDKENIFASFLYYPQHFPYLVTLYHNSPLGNEVLAQQMFDLLMHKTESALAVIQTEDAGKELVAGVQIRKRRLSEYKSITVEMNQVGIGRLYYAGISSLPISLIAFKSPATSILDAVFLPLDFEIKEGTPVSLRFKTSYGIHDVILGRIRLLHPGLNIGVIDFDFQKIDTYNKFIQVDIDAISKIKLLPLKKNDTITVLLNNQQILSARVHSKTGSLNFFSTDGRFGVIRADGDVGISIEDLPTEGIVYAVLSGGEEKIRLPLANWHKIKKKVSLGAQSPRSP
jgi:hypothetical protein